MTRNYARLEAEALLWEEVIEDPLGDLQRENTRLRSGLIFWRALALFLLTFFFVWVALMLLRVV